MGQNGGARPGAGRKPKVKRAVKKVIAEAILASIDEMAAWHELLAATTEEAPDYNIRFKALSYLTDRRDGKAPQGIILTDDSEDNLGLTGVPIPAEFRESGTA